jgi:hypothetical protein
MPNLIEALREISDFSPKSKAKLAPRKERRAKAKSIQSNLKK